MHTQYIHTHTHMYVYIYMYNMHMYMTIRNGRGLELSEDDCIQQNTEILLRRPGGWWAERFRLLHVARHLFSCNHWSLGRWTSCLIYIYILLYITFISCNRWENESLAWNPWYYLFSSPILMPKNPPCLGRGLDKRFDRCHGYRPLHSDSSLGVSAAMTGKGDGNALGDVETGIE